MKLTESQAEAVVRLQNSSDFEHLLEALKAYRHEIVEFVLYGPPEGVETNRGMARGITEVMRALSSARTTLNNLRGRGH